MMRSGLGAFIVVAGFVVCGLPVTAAEFEARTLVLPESLSKAVTPTCSGGIVYDDGTLNSGYALGGAGIDGGAVMRFDLPGGTTSLDQACVCLLRSQYGPTSISFDLVIRDNNGAGGGPGSLIAQQAFTASSISQSPTFFNMNLTGAGITLPDTSVYVGIVWPAIHGSENIFICGDTSSGLTQRSNYFSANNGSTWASYATYFPGSPNNPRALGIRVDPGGSAVPAAPTNLVATATSDDQIRLNWQDNANNETEFRVEQRVGASFVDIGAVGANVTQVNINGLNPATLYEFRVRARNAAGNSAYSNTASATTFGGPGGPCVPSATAMCLNNNRFKVEAVFATHSVGLSDAKVVKLTDDTGYLWFFSAANVEVVVKVNNGCHPVFGNNHYWVFAAGLTNVYVQLKITDTATGAIQTYTNPLDHPYSPLQETSAFATCP